MAGRPPLSNVPQPRAAGSAIDQTRSAPVSKAQLHARAALQPGQLPTMDLRGNPTHTIEAVAAIGAMAVPEIGDFGGGFSSARGLKRQQPEPE
jgi:hypothetical protein